MRDVTRRIRQPETTSHDYREQASMGTSVATADGVRPHAPARRGYVRDRLSAADPLVPVVAVVLGRRPVRSSLYF